MSQPLEDPVVAYIAEASVGSYMEAAFESAFGVHFEDPEWKHCDGSDWCWREMWPTCKCMPLMLVRNPCPPRSPSRLTPLPASQAVLYVLRTIPRRYHLLIKLADTRVARRLADGSFHEQPEPRGEHRRCLAFSTLIPYQLDLRRDCGSRVSFVQTDDEAEDRERMLVAEK